MRNWLIGYYIVEFEQYGKDRANFPIRQVMELFIIYGIDAYERQHGVAMPNGKDIQDLL